MYEKTMHELTPYDTGEVAEPHVWSRPTDLALHGGNPELGRFGKVDFDNDEGVTVCTVQVVRNADGSYTVVVDDYIGDTRVRLS